MRFFDDFKQLKEGYKQLGLFRFVFLIVATLAYIGVGAWLMTIVTWSEQCDTSGRRLWGLVQQFYCSPELLSGSIVEISYFAYLWSMPATILIAAFWTRIKHGKWGWQIKKPSS